MYEWMIYKLTGSALLDGLYCSYMPLRTVTRGHVKGDIWFARVSDFKKKINSMQRQSLCEVTHYEQGQSEARSDRWGRIEV
jgi:hypothetical protein